MNPEQTTEETLFNAARALTGAKQRAAFLAAACEGDVELRRAVELLLLAVPTGDEFFDPGPADRPPDLHPTEATQTAKLDLSAREKTGTVIGRYKLLQKIGEGGMGVVYMAEPSEPVKRRVALKVMKLGMDTREVSARFEAERQALAMMDHPHIAKVLDAGTTEPLGAPASLPAGSLNTANTPARMPALPAGRRYFVMELVHGIRITDYCDQANLKS